MAKTHRILRGSCPLVLTPFKDNEDLDLDALKLHIDWLIDKGAPGLFLAGSWGEYTQLSDDERRQVFETGLKHVAGPGPRVRRHLRPRADDARQRRVRTRGGGSRRRRPDGQAVPLHRRVGAPREGPRGGHPRGAARVLRRDVPRGQHPHHAVQLGVGDRRGEPGGPAGADRPRLHPVRQGVHRHRHDAAGDRTGRRPALRLQRDGGLGVPGLRPRLDGLVQRHRRRHPRALHQAVRPGPAGAVSRGPGALAPHRPAHGLSSRAARASS